MTIESLSPYETATGFPLDPDPRASRGTLAPHGERGRDRRTHDALRVLEELVAGALCRPPCVVHFSGGRDSSAVLAVAAHIARREGLAPPVPLTVRFPGINEAMEDRWQEMVIRHLELPEWIKMDAGDTSDLLGPTAVQVVRRYGVIWSPLLSTRAPFMVPAAGGSIITGEGGDEIFGPRRATSLAGLRQFGRPATTLSRVRGALTSLSPRGARSIRSRNEMGAHLGLEWLRPHVREDFLRRSGRQWASEPLPWGRSIEWVNSLRHVRLGNANMVGLAADAGASLVAPFVEPRFVAALAGAFGPLGPVDRTAAMRHLFGPFLPDALLARRTKAVFTLGAWGPATQEYVRNWTGDGLDSDLVDVDALHGHWTGPRPSAMTFGLVQAAWLATTGT